jgi:hypothetical protein
VGPFETEALASVEGKCEIPPLLFLMSNLLCYPEKGPCVAGSLTGAVASQIVTEARNGWLKLVGNQL